MDQKLFLEKLTEVAEWEWARHTGDSQAITHNGEQGEPPTYPKLTRIKSTSCPYQEDKAGCHWHIYKKSYGRQTIVTVTKCKTCGALLTPKGHYVAKPKSTNYPQVIYQVDRDE
jgi:hypothetical protein